nr:MAG TPA: hypothetical protein [Caudoviricetes sp.]
MHLYYTIKEHEEQVCQGKILNILKIFLCILYLRMRQIKLPFFAHKMATLASSFA